MTLNPESLTLTSEEDWMVRSPSCVSAIDASVFRSKSVTEIVITPPMLIEIGSAWCFGFRVENCGSRD